MTCEHPCHSSRGCRFLGTLLGSAALGAAITYVLFGAGPSNARAHLPHQRDTLAHEVSVAGQLVKAVRGWSVQLKATNPAATERRCNIAVSLTRTQSNAMSRVLPAPRVMWKASVAVTVPAMGELSEQLAIPAGVAKDIPDPTPRPSLPGARDYYGLQVQANCDGGNGDQVS